jgi:hypothetical protein
MSQVPQKTAPNNLRMWGKSNFECYLLTGEQKMQEQKQWQRPAQILPVVRAFASDYSTLPFSSCWPLPNFLWASLFPTYPYRALTASPTVEKGTPPAQLFGNRSVT